MSCWAPGRRALAAAIRASDGGANVGLFEKADTVGGTSAWSGGMVWIPVNPHMAELGIEDSREEALTYLHSLSHGLIDTDLAAALIDAGPEMVTWFEANTPVRFQVIKDLPDYHPEHPGAKPGGGRSLECPLYPFADLGAWQDRVTVGPQLSGNITMSETSLGRGAPSGVAPAGTGAAAKHPRRTRRRARPDRRHCSAPAWTAGSNRAPACGAVELIVDDRPSGRRPLRDRRGSVDVGARARRDPRDRRIRMGSRAGAGVRPRTARALSLGPDQYWRRSEDGYAHRRWARQYARGLVGSHDRRASWRPDSGLAGQRRADPAALHHGEQAGPAVHQRGGELQRTRRCVPRDRRKQLRLRQSSRLDGLRPALLDAVRTRRLPGGRSRLRNGSSRRRL